MVIWIKYQSTQAIWKLIERDTMYIGPCTKKKNWSPSLYTNVLQWYPMCSGILQYWGTWWSQDTDIHSKINVKLSTDKVKEYFSSRIFSSAAAHNIQTPSTSIKISITAGNECMNQDYFCSKYLSTESKVEKQVALKKYI